MIPKTVFVLDRYHVNKSVTAAAGADQALHSALCRSLVELDRKAMNQLLQEAFERTDADCRRKSIRDTQRYLNRQWGGIVCGHRSRGIWLGRSSEGYVSHICADRLSSRPEAWRQEGVDQMV